MNRPSDRAIWLVSLGDTLHVKVEDEHGQWITVIRESYDGGPISHIVEPGGIARLLDRARELDASGAASPADDAGVRVEAAAEALAKMIIRQEALTMKTPEAAMHHMAHWRRAIEEGRDLLDTLNRVAADAAADTAMGAGQEGFDG